MNSLISVIIPIYNVERYLKDCVKSVVNQTYKQLEIILVDDGSSDNSGKICDELAKNDSRIKVIHKVNGGLSDARNRGIEESLGEYISFVDSDDVIKPTFIQRLYELITSNDCQVAQVGTMRISEDGKDLNNPILFLENSRDKYDNIFILTREEFIRYILLEKVHCAAWCNLYKRSFFKEVRFAKGKVNEDFLMWLTGIEYLDKIAVSNDELYEYRFREGSITSLSNSEKHFADSIENSQKWLAKVSIDYPKYTQEAYYHLFTVLLSYLKLKSTTNKNQKYVEIIQQNISIILKNRYLSIPNKIFSMMLYIAPKVSINVWNFIRK